MNAAVGVRTPAAALAEIGQEETRTKRQMFARFKHALNESRRKEACRVIARHAHLLPADHPWRARPH
jgi:hypothetical protein